MRQILFEVPGLGVKLFGFGAMLVVALYASLQISVWRAKRVRLDPEIFMDLAIWLVVSGIIGARLVYVVQHAEVIHNPLDIFKVWSGGIVFYGCIMGGAAGFLIYRAKHPFPFLPAIDVVAPALAVGVAIGRIGCFLNGCCYGDLCNLPWAVQFPAHSLPWIAQVREGLITKSAPFSLPVHPTQLYSALDGFLVLALLSAYFPLRRRDGEVMALVMVTYPVSRFLIECLRNDEGAFFLGMTISQNISILLFVGGIAFWWYLSRLPAGRYADRAQARTLLRAPRQGTVSSIK
jgi:phosphatidylglycerol:prolipoprotein diacylglycerol transferase